MPLRKRTDYLVVHVTATPPTSDIGVKEVDAMHKAQGWSGCGYHFVIRRNGKVETGRPEKDVGAHVKGFNSVSVGISLVGGVDAKGKPEHNATPEQMAALETLLRELVERYPNAKVCGHRDLSPDKNGNGIIESGEWLKACPCFDVIPWAKSVGLPAASIRTGSAPKGPDERAAWLQGLLVKGGYKPGPVDGIVGSKTKAAIKAFQTFEGLPKTGDFDAATVKRLRAKFEAAAEPAQPPVVTPDEPTQPKPETPAGEAPKPSTGFRPNWLKIGLWAAAILILVFALT